VSSTLTPLQTPRSSYPPNGPLGPQDRRRPSRISLGTLLLILLLLLAVALAVVWQTTGTVHHQISTVSMSGVRHADVTLNLGAGSLHVSGAAATGNAVEAAFAYNTPGVNWDESRSGGTLALTVGQKSGSVFNPFTMKNDWTIRLSRHLPLSLRINSGAGEAVLDLRHVDLRSLDVNGGAGSIRIDLRRAWTTNVNVAVHGGVGETTIDVPTSVGVVARVHAGIGSMQVTGLVARNGDYVNEQYGRSPTTLSVSVDQGVGTVKLTTG
jgi:uncharacterized protein DUF2154